MSCRFPEPGPTEVLVRTDALAVNAVDVLVRSGAYPSPTPFPFVIGRDLVGTVAAAGSGPPSSPWGTRVRYRSDPGHPLTFLTEVIPRLVR